MAEKIKIAAKGLPEIRSEYIWAITFILFIAPMLYPLGTKVEMTQMTLDIYNNIQALPSGTILITGGAGVFSFMLECSAAYIAFIKQAARQHLRLVNLPLGVENVPYFQYCIDAAGVDQSKGGPWKYGTDYVALPYLAGGDATRISFLQDVKKTVNTDVFGTPISDLPLMNDVKNSKNFAYWIDSTGTDIPSLARYSIGQFQLPVIGFIHAYYYAVYTPYLAMYPGKIWFTNGIVGGAQYETLMGYSSLGHTGMDTYQIVSVYFFVLFALGNIVMYSGRKKEEQQ
jgi:hypothetical protein